MGTGREEHHDFENSNNSLFPYWLPPPFSPWVTPAKPGPHTRDKAGLCLHGGTPHRTQNDFRWYQATNLAGLQTNVVQTFWERRQHMSANGFLSPWQLWIPIYCGLGSSWKWVSVLAGFLFIRSFSGLILLLWTPICRYFQSICTNAGKCFSSTHSTSFS